MRDIVCLAPDPWQGVPTRTQQLMSRMKGAEVLYFEPPEPRGGKEHKKPGRKMRPGVTVYTLPPIWDVSERQTFRFHRNQRRVADYVLDILNKRNIREPVLWCATPRGVHLLDFLPYRGLVYDCHRFWSDEFLDWESDLTRHAEVVFAASPGLIKRLSPCNDNIALLPNGVNPLLFQQKQRNIPPELVGLPGQRVLGRLGSVTGQLDLEPLLYAADHRPEWTFVLMGRVTKPAAEQLRGRNNIVLTGAVNPLDVPDYLYRCDLLFDLMRFDRPGDVVPIRVYEYLATGRPIVTVVDPDVLETIPELVSTAYDGPGFLRRCKAAFGEDPGLPRRRRAMAKDSSWTARAAQVSDILEVAGLF